MSKIFDEISGEMSEILSNLYPHEWFDFELPNEQDNKMEGSINGMSAGVLILSGLSSCFSIVLKESGKILDHEVGIEGGNLDGNSDGNSAKVPQGFDKNIKSTLIDIESSLKATFSKNPLINSRWKHSLSVFLIPLLFESRILNNAKSKGAYYTPPVIAYFIASECINGYFKTGNGGNIGLKMPKILDPACGGGVFLLSAFEILTENLLSKNSAKKAPSDNINGIHMHMDILSHLFGYDIDKNAINAAKIALLTSFLIKNYRELDIFNQDMIHNKSLLYINKIVKILNDNLLVVDPLLTLNKKTNLTSFINQATLLADFHRQYNIVMANPPYISSKVLDSNYKKRLKDNFKTATRQMDLFSVFTELGLNLLEDGGFLGYLIPDAFLGRVNNTELRHLILSRTKIDSLFHISNIFEPQLANVIIIAIKHAKNIDTEENKTFKFFEGRFNRNRGNLTPIDTNRLKQKLFLKTPGYRIINIDSALLKTLLKIRNQSEKVGTVCKIFRGEEIGKANSILIKDGNEKKDGARTDLPDVHMKNGAAAGEYLPILTGGDITKYLPSHSSKSNLFIEKSNVKKDLRNYLIKKIMIRQLGSEINAAIDLSGEYITLQTVYNLLPKSNELSLIALLVYLNSLFINTYYNIFYGEKLLFPRIIIADIKELPIPTNFPEISADLEGIGLEILSLLESGNEMHPQIKSLQTEADEIILNNFLNLKTISAISMQDLKRRLK